MLPIRKKNTVRAYRWIIDKFCADFGEEELAGLSSEKILQFFNIVTDGCKPQTKRVRFSHLSSFFNFLKNNLELNFQNPCDLPMLRKLFRPTVSVRWNIIEKETVDEIIFRTTNVRNRFRVFRQSQQLSVIVAHWDTFTTSAKTIVTNKT